MTSQHPLNLQQNEARSEGSSSSGIASKNLQSSQPLETVLNESPSDGGTNNISTNAGLIQTSTSTGNKRLGLCYRPSLPFSISPKEPQPRVIGPRSQNKHDRKRGKTEIIKGGPYKLELEEEEREKKRTKKNSKAEKKVCQNSFLNTKMEHHKLAF